MIKNSLTLAYLIAALFLVTGCDIVPLHMRQQPRFDPLEESSLFANRMASRPLPPNTIPRGEWGLIKLDEPFYTGQENGNYLANVPLDIDRDLLMRGRQQYDVYCAPCHDRTGAGNGMIVQRGFPQPPSFHIDRLRQQPDGYFYDVISNGFGVMYSYSARVKPEDRWAITAYIRALQFSQNVPVDQLPDDIAQEIETLIEESQPEEGDNESN